MGDPTSNLLHYAHRSHQPPPPPPLPTNLTFQPGYTIAHLAPLAPLLRTGCTKIRPAPPDNDRRAPPATLDLRDLYTHPAQPLNQHSAVEPVDIDDHIGRSSSHEVPDLGDDRPRLANNVNSDRSFTSGTSERGGARRSRRERDFPVSRILEPTHTCTLSSLLSPSLSHRDVGPSWDERGRHLELA